MRALANTMQSTPLAADLDHVLAHTTEVWEHLRGARLFVTGGTGFFGCWLLESFAWACDRLQLGATLTALTRSPEAFRAKAPHLASHPAIRMVTGDVRSCDFPPGRYSHFIHAAADATPALCRQQPLLVFDTIVDGTRNVLDFAVEAHAQRFLLISSGAIYGPQAPEVDCIPEDSCSGPDLTDVSAVYAEAKRAAELLCAIYRQQHGLDCLIARCFAFLGPYLPLDAHFAIGNFILDQSRGGPIEVRSDGSASRSYLYAADLAIWLWTILVKGQPCRPYNVGSDQAYTIRELALNVAATLQPPTAVRIAGSPVEGAPARRYVPSVQRAFDELNLRPLIPLPEAIRRTAAQSLTTHHKGAHL